MPLSGTPFYGFTLSATGGPSVSLDETEQPTFPRTIKLDSDGDFDVSGGTLHLLAGSDSIVQDIKARLQCFKGEWFLDLDSGIPYFQEVLIKAPNPNALQTIFRKALEDATGVSEIKALTLTREASTRKLTVAFRIATDVGELADRVSV